MLPRKHAFGSQKRNKRKRIEEVIKTQRGALDKFLKPSSSVEDANSTGPIFFILPRATEMSGPALLQGRTGPALKALVGFIYLVIVIFFMSVYAAGDEKYAHLWKLENAAEKLKIFKADLLDFDTILAAVKGCDGVFHVASPVPQGSVPNPEEELVEPAVNGTLNVLKACSEAKVGRVVVVSSVAAVLMKPNWPKDQVIDETCWSDKEYCRETNNWYCFSKTVAEAEAWEYAKKSGLNMVTVCPSLVLGPMLQHTANASSLALMKLLKEGIGEIENNLRKLVDVRDVAEALKLVYEKAEAEGRYICSAHMIKAEDLLTLLKTLYPNYFYPQLKEGKDQLKLSSEKLQKLGWNYRPLKETLVDSIESYKQLGLIWF